MTLKTSANKVKLLLLGFLMILLLLGAGQLLNIFLPLPAPVLGLLLCALFCALLGGVPKPLLMISQLLLSNMALFFLPLIVSATLYIDMIKAIWLPILLSLVFSTLVAIAITAKLADRKMQEVEDED